jgi:hypothetical protein
LHVFRLAPYYSNMYHFQCVVIWLAVTLPLPTPMQEESNKQAEIVGMICIGIHTPIKLLYCTRT